MEANKTQLHVEELDDRIVPSAPIARGPFRFVGEATQQHIRVPQQNTDRNDRDDVNGRPDRTPGQHNTPNQGRNHNTQHQNSNNTTPHRAQGSAQGTYTGTGESGELGQTHYLHGNVRLPGLGTLKLTGRVHEVGDVIQGRAGGQLVLSSRIGSLTLQLSAVEQSATGGLPSVFSFRVVDGTGKLTHASGQGKLMLVMTPLDDATGTFAMKFVRRAAV